MRLSSRHGVSIACTVPLVMCLGVFGCSQRDTTDPSNMTCVKRLQIPSYPTIARLARASFETSAAIRLATDGKIQSVVLEGATGLEQLFRPTIEETLRASAFEPSCSHKTVRVSYAFRMNVAPDVTASWFGYPNRVEVWAVSPPVDVNHTSAAPNE